MWSQERRLFYLGASGMRESKYIDVGPTGLTWPFWGMFSSHENIPAPSLGGLSHINSELSRAQIKHLCELSRDLNLKYEQELHFVAMLGRNYRALSEHLEFMRFPEAFQSARFFNSPVRVANHSPVSAPSPKNKKRQPKRKKPKNRTVYR